MLKPLNQQQHRDAHMPELMLYKAKTTNKNMQRIKAIRYWKEGDKYKEKNLNSRALALSAFYV